MVPADIHRGRRPGIAADPEFVHLDTGLAEPGGVPALVAAGWPETVTTVAGAVFMIVRNGTGLVLTSTCRATGGQRRACACRATAAATAAPAPSPPIKQPGRIGAQLGGMIGRPVQHVQPVVRARRVAAYRQHHQTRVLAQGPARGLRHRRRRCRTPAAGPGATPAGRASRRAPGPGVGIAPELSHVGLILGEGTRQGPLSGIRLCSKGKAGCVWQSVQDLHDRRPPGQAMTGDNRGTWTTKASRPTCVRRCSRSLGLQAPGRDRTAAH